ncbi:MAG: hypothetical protein IPP66_18350 [Anaerolineales bacterium]|nr:hypothetical protein [Anaerolineales bacterium]
MAIRSLIETVACQRIISRRNYVTEQAYISQIDLKAQELAKKLHAFRKSLSKTNKRISESSILYETNEF